MLVSDGMRKLRGSWERPSWWAPIKVNHYSLFLALSGAHDVTMYICLSGTNLSRELNLHPPLSGLSQVSWSSLTHFVVQTEPKILHLVLFVVKILAKFFWTQTQKYETSARGAILYRVSHKNYTLFRRAVAVAVGAYRCSASWAPNSTLTLSRIFSGGYKYNL